VLALFGASAKAHGASDQQLAQSALMLTGEFDAMAKITGQSREAQAAALQQMETDAAWKLKASQMSADELANQNAALAEITATMGPTAANLYKMHVLGIVPLTKDMQLLQATTPGLGRSFDGLAAKMKSGKFNPKEMDDMMGDLIQASVKSGTGLQNAMNAASSGLDDATVGSLAKVQAEVMAHKDEYLVNGVFNKKLFDQKMEAARADQKHGDAARAAMADWNAKMKQLQDQFTQTVLIPLLEKVTPVIQQIVAVFTSPEMQAQIQGIFSYVMSIVSSIGDFITENASMIKGFIVDSFSTIFSIISAIMKVAAFIGRHFDTIMTITKVITVVVLGILAVAGLLAIGLGIAATAFMIIEAPIWAVIAALVAFVAVVWAAWAMISKLFPGKSSGPAQAMPAIKMPMGTTMPAVSGMAPEPTAKPAAGTPMNPTTGKPMTEKEITEMTTTQSLAPGTSDQSEILNKIYKEMQASNEYNARTVRGIGQLIMQTA
jgi:hypothetical protein